jgi:hypothetical protein
MANSGPTIRRHSFAFWSAVAVLMIFVNSTLALWLASTLVDLFS